MIRGLLKEKAGALAFGFAAALAPVIMLLPSSCGSFCAGCPLSGGCLTVPVVAAGIGALGLGARIRATAGRFIGGRA
jgi:hypothetical protein